MSGTGNFCRAGPQLGKTCRAARQKASCSTTRTPARHIYFPVMMMYLDEAGAQRYYDEFVRRLTEFMNVIGNPVILTECVEISKNCMEREYYKALMRCRKLMDYEDERLGHVPSSVPKGGDLG